MATKRPRLNHRLIQEICTYIQNGAFEKIACEAAGVPYEVFTSWLTHAQKKNAGGIYRTLLAEVKQARARARLHIEIHMRRENPRLWLLQGPGKETPGQPGWSAPPRANAAAQGTPEIPAELLELIVAINQALIPFPEARAALAPVVGRFFPEANESTGKRQRLAETDKTGEA